MAIKVKFAFMVQAEDDENGEQPVLFTIEGSANAKALIGMGDSDSPTGSKGAIILPHKLPGQFNVIGFSRRGDEVGYSFTNIADVQQLGEHLRGLGVKQDTIDVWNQQSGHPVPKHDKAVDDEAAAAITRMLAGAKPGAKKLE